MNNRACCHVKLCHLVSYNIKDEIIFNFDSNLTHFENHKSRIVYEILTTNIDNDPIINVNLVKNILLHTLVQD